MISVSEFAETCEDGDMVVVNFRIKQKLNAGNSSEGYWNWGLKGACRGGHLNIVNLMIQLGANDWNGGLHEACEKGHLDIIKLMVEKGANGLKNELWDACRRGYLDVVNFMIERNVGNYCMGLRGARWGGHLEIAKLMIKNGADDWKYVFDFAPGIIDSDIVNLIIDKNIPIEKYLSYPRNKTGILNLYGSGLPIDKFENIDGIEGLIEEIEKIKKRRNVIENVLSENLINDLMGSVTKYVID